MVNITDGNKTFWQVEQIYIGDMHLQDKKYFGLEGMVNIQTDLYGPLRVAAIKNSKNGSAQEIVNFRDRVYLGVIYEAI